ncbi:hypothetical protein IP84_02755 [beta proteobacterium AAP99]|nr:hypothetical protein IP84_02755 [beta proteobacterium AAP99]
MSLLPSRPRALLAALILVLGLSGCSALREGYNNLDTLAMWWVTRMVSLDDVQKAQLRAGMQRLIVWHRRNELAEWSAMITEARRATDNALTEDELQALDARLSASLTRTLQVAATELAPVLRSLSDAQWQELERSIDKQGAQAAKRWSGSDERVRAERAKGFERSLERWIGDVDRSQRAQIVAMERSWPLDRSASLRSAEQRRAEIKQALRTLARADLPIEQARAPLLRSLERGPGADKIAASPQGDHALQVRNAVMRSIVQFINAPSSAGDSMRQQMHQRWQGWQRDIDRLRAEAPV